MKPPDWSVMPDIIALVEKLEAKLTALGAHDNQRCQGLWLRLYPDGSGDVMGDYSKASSEETKEQWILRTVMTMEYHSLFEFRTLEECHGELIAMTMRVGKGKP